MRRVIALAHHDPRYLKETYRHPLIQHVDDERHIPTGARYLSWDRGYRVWKMPFSRKPIPVGKFRSIHEAISHTSE